MPILREPAEKDGRLGRGVDVLEDNGERRISSLYSTEASGKVTRTYAIVDYVGPAKAAYADVHERIRAGGAGIPAFFTPTTVGTVLAEGKEVREFDGRPYVMEPWLKADYALVKCEVADTLGNLTFNKTARNFSPLMCMAATTTIVQARKLVERGGIDPEHVVTPGIFVNRVVAVPDPVHEDVLIAAERSYP